jgi:UDP-glucose 4-epimerase
MKHKPEIVIHHAAQVSVEYSTHHPQKDSEINILGTIKILKLCRYIRYRNLSSLRQQLL